MTWTIRINDLVGQEDLKYLPAHVKSKIFKAIYKKLSVDPKAFGKPLTGLYKGYWRLRVDDYRVIYRIHDQEVVVYIVLIGLRKDDAVYKQLVSRLHKLNGF